MAKKMNARREIDRRAQGDIALFNILSSALDKGGVHALRGRRDLVDGVEMYNVSRDKHLTTCAGVDDEFIYVFHEPWRDYSHDDCDGDWTDGDHLGYVCRFPKAGRSGYLDYF
jgi:hypothetical protein